MTSGDERVQKLVGDYLERKVDRRGFLQRAAALGLSLSAASALLAACGGGEEAAPPPPSPHRRACSRRPSRPRTRGRPPSPRRPALARRAGRLGSGC